MYSALVMLWLLSSSSSITPGLKKPDSGRKKTYQWDDSGYILYCPCMGRFGNQAAHFLGSLAFAKAMNRTLVIPPWRCHQHQRNIPYTEFFRLDSILHYHRALLLEDFMEQLAPTHWPPGNRTGYCYGPSSRVTDREDCDMKYGNPFGPFWDAFSVEFDRSEFTQMSYTINREVVLKRWIERYPVSTHPVMAFKGAPASFPVLPEHRYLHKYMRWNPTMEEEAFQFIDNSFGAGANFIAVHLRMGVDWERACKSAVGQQKFMESVQCLEGMPGALITQSLCLPSLDEVTQYLAALTRRTRVYNVFVASDVPAEKHGLQQWLGGRVKTYFLPPGFPQLDLAIMAKAQHFVGNCISSFSAFVKRERDFLRKHSDFFGWTEIKENYESKKKTEL